MGAVHYIDMPAIGTKKGDHLDFGKDNFARLKSITLLSQRSRGRHAFRNEPESALALRRIISHLFFSFVGGAR